MQSKFSFLVFILAIVPCLAGLKSASASSGMSSPRTSYIGLNAIGPAAFSIHPSLIGTGLIWDQVRHPEKYTFSLQLEALSKRLWVAPEFLVSISALKEISPNIELGPKIGYRANFSTVHESFAAVAARIVHRDAEPEGLIKGTFAEWNLGVTGATFLSFSLGFYVF